MKAAVVVLAAGVLLSATALVMRAAPIEDAGAPSQVVFVCRNGVSMSVWSAAYFNRLAADRGLRERAVARSTLPSYATVPLRMKLALALDGFRVGDYRPRVVSREDARRADLVVVIQSSDGTQLPGDVLSVAPRVEAWTGFPPMREEFFPARGALRARIEALAERLAAKPARTSR